MRRYDIQATLHLPHWEQEKLTPFYWIPYHFIFAEEGAVREFGKQWLPFDVLVYTKARSRKTLQFLVLREWAINGGRLAVLIIIGIMIALGTNWLVAFVLAAVFSVLTIFMGKG